MSNVGTGLFLVCAFTSTAALVCIALLLATLVDRESKHLKVKPDRSKADRDPPRDD